MLQMQTRHDNIVQLVRIIIPSRFPNLIDQLCLEPSLHGVISASHWVFFSFLVFLGKVFFLLSVDWRRTIYL